MPRVVGMSPDGRTIVEDDNGNQIAVAADLAPNAMGALAPQSAVDISGYENIQNQLSSGGFSDPNTPYNPTSPDNPRANEALNDPRVLGMVQEPVQPEPPMDRPYVQDIAASFGVQQKPKAMPVESSPAPKEMALDGTQNKPELSSISKAYGQIAKGYDQARNAEINYQRGVTNEMMVRDQYLKDQMEEEKKIMARRQEAFDRDIQKTQAISDKYAQSEIVNPWANASTGTKIASALAIALGAVGAMNGGPNRAIQVIDKAIDDDVKLQMHNLDRLGQSYNMQRQYMRDVAENYDSQDARRSVLRQLAYQAVENKLAQYGAKKSELMASANYNDLMGKLINSKENEGLERAKKSADVMESMAKAQATLQNPSGKSVTSDQAKAGGFARRLEQAEGVFNQLENEGFDRASYSTSIGKSILPESLETEKQMQQDQAERNFVNAILRRESGAAISPSEFSSAEKQYFPRAGNSEKVKEQKRQNRMQAMAALQGEAGPALGIIPQVSNIAPNKKQQAMDWLRSNPNHPKAKEVRKALGQ